MSAYFTTHHFSPHWTTPRHPQADEAHLHPPPITTTITAPSIAPPHPASASEAPSPSYRHLTLDTLAHLLHDFHVQSSRSAGDRDPVTHRTVARPHFDLLENKTLYVIYGELAGLSRKDVEVEVNDHLFTITISGHLKRLAPPPAQREAGAAATDDGVGVVHRDQAAQPAAAAGQVGGKAPEGAAAAAPTAEGDSGTEKVLDQDVHWHVTERKVGEFRRAFQFPIETVDMAAVSASMRDGLLCVTVPKKLAEKKEGAARKVEIA